MQLPRVAIAVSQLGKGCSLLACLVLVIPLETLTPILHSVQLQVPSQGLRRMGVPLKSWAKAGPACTRYGSVK